jgi:hypothetical protein
MWRSKTRNSSLESLCAKPYGMRLIEDGHMQDSKRPRGTIGAGRADVTAPPPASFSTSQGHQAKEPPLPGVDVSQLTNVEGINFIIRV